MMDIQTKASFHKEMLAFLRTYKLLILICVIVGWSVISPVLIVSLGALVDTMTPIYDELGVDVGGLTGELTATASIGVASQISDISSIGLIVFLMVINSFAGGEQRKRSIIIPQSSGLSSFSYIMPKFAIYPLTVFILSLTGTFAASIVSGFIFKSNDLIFINVLYAGILLGVYNMFYVCLHLTLGTGTGKPWISSAICIGASLILPSIFTITNATPAYNPFTISGAAASALVGNESGTDIITGILVAAILMIILFSIAIFAQKAKKIDNSGNEMLI